MLFGWQTRIHDKEQSTGNPVSCSERGVKKPLKEFPKHPTTPHYLAALINFLCLTLKADFFKEIRLLLSWERSNRNLKKQCRLVTNVSDYFVIIWTETQDLIDLTQLSFQFITQVFWKLWIKKSFLCKSHPIRMLLRWTYILATLLVGNKVDSIVRKVIPNTFPIQLLH